MGIPPDGIGRGEGGLGRTEGRATRGERSTDKEVGQVGVERAGVTVVDQSVDWNTSFANYAWLILWTAVYQASRSVLAGRSKGMVAI